MLSLLAEKALDDLELSFLEDSEAAEMLFEEVDLVTIEIKV